MGYLRNSAWLITGQREYGIFYHRTLSTVLKPIWLLKDFEYRPEFGWITQWHKANPWLTWPCSTILRITWNFDIFRIGVDQVRGMKLSLQCIYGFQNSDILLKFVEVLQSTTKQIDIQYGYAQSIFARVSELKNVNDGLRSGVTDNIVALTVKVLNLGLRFGGVMDDMAINSSCLGNFGILCCRAADGVVVLQTYNYNDVKISIMVSQITSKSTVCSNIYSGAYQRKHQCSASLAFWGESAGDRWFRLSKCQ